MAVSPIFENAGGVEETAHVDEFITHIPALETHPSLFAAGSEVVSTRKRQMWAQTSRVRTSAVWKRTTSAIPHALPATLGENVGDSAGTGADLCGSFSEVTCVALVLVAPSKDLQSSWKTFMCLVLISSLGIVVGIVMLTLRNVIYRVHDEFGAVEKALKGILIVNAVLMSPVAVALSWAALPDEFNKSETITGVLYHRLHHPQLQRFRRRHQCRLVQPTIQVLPTRFICISCQIFVDELHTFRSYLGCLPTVTSTRSGWSQQAQARDCVQVFRGHEFSTVNSKGSFGLEH